MKLSTTPRNLNKQRLNSVIIIAGMAIGIACTNLIILFITKELSTDSFQKNGDRIYALQADNPFVKGGKMYQIRSGAAEFMKDNYSEVEDFCRISNANPIKIIANNNDYFDGTKVIAASSNFFRFFSYDLLYGSPENSLKTPDDIVISEDLAIKYFGTNDPVGSTIRLANAGSDNEMTITAVFKKPKENTLLNFDMIRLIGQSDSRCFLMLAPDVSTASLEKKFDENRNIIPIIYSGTPGTHYLKSLKEAYFDTSRSMTIESSRNRKDLSVASIIAVMILVVALLNYLGLINNQLIEKRKEYAVRRVNGGSNKNLVMAFMMDCTVLVFSSFALSLIVMNLVLPLFNSLTSSDISIYYIFQRLNIPILLTVVLVVLIITFLFVSVRIAKNPQTEALTPGKYLPDNKFIIPAFNVAQISVTVVLIIGSLVIFKQMTYINNKNIGLNKDVIEVRIPQSHQNLVAVFKSELESQPAVEMVSVTTASPVLEHYLVLLEYEDQGVKKEYTAGMFQGDKNYIQALGIDLIAGEDFSQDKGSNQEKCIINKSLASMFQGEKMVGATLPGSDGTTIIGICEDFHYGSLKDLIEPAYINYSEQGYHLLVKPNPGNSAATVQIISKIWEDMIDDYPLSIESVGERYEWMHRENSNYAGLIGSCCVIAILLSMIGLFSVSYYSSRRRIKEIGIRKINGAKIPEIIILLTVGYLKWVFISFIIAMPLAWYIMRKWLENYAYRTNLSWWIFAISICLATIVALLTVSGQSLRAATKNPVEALRYE